MDTVILMRSAHQRVKDSRKKEEGTIKARAKASPWYFTVNVIRAASRAISAKFCFYGNQRAKARAQDNAIIVVIQDTLPSIAPKEKARGRQVKVVVMYRLFFGISDYSSRAEAQMTMRCRTIPHRSGMIPINRMMLFFVFFLGGVIGTG